MERNVHFEQVLAEYIRPLSHTIAAKFLRNTPVPGNARRPQDICGHRLALCQGMAMVRRNGWTMVFGKEDHACPSAVIAMGHMDSPAYVSEGNIAVNLYAKDMAAAVRCEEATLRMPLESVDDVLIAPLSKAQFEPDVLLIYGMPGQIVRLVQGANFVPGGAVESRFGGRFACSSELVVPYLQQKYNVILPGGGERIFAMTENHEMAFAMPANKMEDMIEGLIATHKSGIQRFPFPIAGVRLQPQFPPSYGEFEEYCGLERTTPAK